MKSVLFLSLIAVSLAIPLPVPPNCPQMLADAEQAIKDCDGRIEQATMAINTTSPELDRAVDDAAAAKTRASQNLNTAINHDNLDRSKLANDQASLQNAKNNLINIQNNCKSPAPPVDCAKQIADAQAAIDNWNNVVDQDNSQIQNDDAIVAYDTQLLQQASDAYDAAVQNRTTVMKQLQDNLQQAVDAKAAAEQHLEDVQQECQMLVRINAPPADCPTLLQQAQQAVSAAGDNVKKATDAYNAEMPQLDAAVTAAQNKINADTNTLNADVTRDNSDKTYLMNQQAHLGDAQNNLANIQKTCSGPAPPPDCATQIANAQAAVQQAQQAVYNAQSAVNNDEIVVAQDKQLLSNDQIAYNNAVAYRDSTRQQYQQAIDDATTAYNAAEKNYEDIQQECQQ